MIMKIKYFGVSLIKYFTLVFGSFMALVPIVVIFFASFKDNKEMSQSGGHLNCQVIG